MDKSMMPILVALLAVVAAGAALALQGGGEDGNREIPSGYPPGDSPDSGQEGSGGTKWIMFADDQLTASVGKNATIVVTICNASLDEVEWSYPEGINLDKADEEVHDSNTIFKMIVWAPRVPGDYVVTAKVGDFTSSCTVKVLKEKPTPAPVGPDEPVGPDAPAGVPSVSGASLAMEFYLKLAPGGSEAIEVPSEYLIMLSGVEWSSSDPSVCEVSADSEAGTVVALAHKTGKCDLTASLGFYYAVCHVTVERSQ